MRSAWPKCILIILIQQWHFFKKKRAILKRGKTTNNSTWKHLDIAGSGDQVKSVQSFHNPKSIQPPQSGVVEGRARPPPPQPYRRVSASFTPSLFLAWRCQPLWNQFLHWRFRSIYIFQFIYTHYQEIARGRSNLSTCNIKPPKSFLVTLFWFWIDVISNQGEWNI